MTPEQNRDKKRKHRFRDLSRRYPPNISSSRRRVDVIEAPEIRKARKMPQSSKKDDSAEKRTMVPWSLETAIAQLQKYTHHLFRKSRIAIEWTRQRAETRIKSRDDAEVAKRFVIMFIWPPRRG